MSTPLYDALLALSGSDPLRLHMPGHKGLAGGLFEAISAIDFTEITPTGNPYTGEGPIRQAELLCARAVGARDALFFTCGSTQGIFTMLSAAVGLDGTLLLDRGCHKSVYHGMGLLDITPVYLSPAPLQGTALASPLSPEDAEAALTAHPEAKALFVTSPSYYGLRADISALAQVCHAHGVYLLVDEAHGAHFPFVGLPAAAALGADLAVVSTHKTWPALGSSSILYVGQDFPMDVLRLKELSAYFATTSPSYPILASIDFAREQLEGEAEEAYRDTARRTAKLRRRINEETPFHALCGEDGLSLDPCRLTVDTLTAGLSGHRASELLEQQNIYMEMADERYLVAILTCADGEAVFRRLWAGLQSLIPYAGQDPIEPPLALPPLPERRQSIRSALFGDRELVPLKDAACRISAQIVAPYPPGVPILAPGEEITEKHIAYLQKKSYNISGPTAVLKSTGFSR